MANQEQLDRLLKQGVQAWNEWRLEREPRCTNRPHRC